MIKYSYFVLQKDASLVTLLTELIRSLAEFSSLFLNRLMTTDTMLTQTPVQTTPVQTTSIQTAPVQTTPVQTTPPTDVYSIDLESFHRQQKTATEPMKSADLIFNLFKQSENRSGPLKGSFNFGNSMNSMSSRVKEDSEDCAGCRRQREDSPNTSLKKRCLQEPSCCRMKPFSFQKEPEVRQLENKEELKEDESSMRDLLSTLIKQLSSSVTGDSGGINSTQNDTTSSSSMSDISPSKTPETELASSESILDDLIEALSREHGLAAVPGAFPSEILNAMDSNRPVKTDSGTSSSYTYC